jgi:GTP-binding protein EngB required for normal cell division
MRLGRLLAIVAIAAMVLLLLLIATRAITLAREVAALPAAWQWAIGALVVAGLTAIGAVAWWLWRPARPRLSRVVPDRPALQARIEALESSGAAAPGARAELAELDRRREGGQVHVAVFGDISMGKSSLVRALIPGADAATGVAGGTTRDIRLHRGERDGIAWVLADVPGNREAGGEAFEASAREEALRAHAVIYVCTAELTRSQASDVAWLAGFGKPMVVALNKADERNAAELKLVLGRLREQLRDSADAVVPTIAGGTEVFVRELPDGRSERVERTRLPDTHELARALDRLIGRGAQALEPAREKAVFAALDARLTVSETAAREAEAARIVARFARRAVIGAMAAVAPGSDLVIQGVIATGMVRALADLYGVSASQVQVDDFIRQARLTLRSGSSIVLAVAGNALKAFPGLGTLGGGLLHAFAYALIFDSMGKALSASLAEKHALDHDDANERLKAWLADSNGERVKALAAMAAEALRDPVGSSGSVRPG